jgi:hypothetical protein
VILALKCVLNKIAEQNYCALTAELDIGKEGVPRANETNAYILNSRYLKNNE